MFYVGIYSAIGVGTAIVQVTSNTVQFTGAIRASRILFQRLLNAVVMATVRFHDTTPAGKTFSQCMRDALIDRSLGRMLNRFSKDIETIDSNLASSLQAVNQSLAIFFASLITVTVIFPGFLIPAVFIGYVYVKLGIGYLNTGRDLRRMESTNRSPIFSDFAELLDGVYTLFYLDISVFDIQTGIVTVRAFSAESNFLNNLFDKIDLFQDVSGINMLFTFMTDSDTFQMLYQFWMT